MHWIIDGSPLGSGRGGDETYATSILSGLSQTALSTTQENVTVVRRRTTRKSDIGATYPTTLRDVGACVRTSARSGAGFYGLAFPLAVRQLAGDAVLSFTHAPASIGRARTGMVLAVLDLSFEHLPAAYPRATRARLRSIIRHQVDVADRIATISEWSKQDMIDTYSIDPDRVHVIPGSVSLPVAIPLEREVALRAWKRSVGISDRYVLYLGNLHPRKNVATAIRAFARGPRRSGYQMVLAGARWWGEDETRAIESLGLSPSEIVLTGQVTDEQREVLLRGAACMIYPSIFEGFGLPPLEAMARGIPVVASRSTAIPEVLGDAALLVDALDDQSMADAMVRAADCAETRQSLIAAGRHRAAHWSIARTGHAARAALVVAAAQRTGAAPWVG